MFIHYHLQWPVGFTNTKIVLINLVKKRLNKYVLKYWTIKFFLISYANDSLGGR